MENYNSLTLVTRIKDGQFNDFIQRYLDRGYSIQSSSNLDYFDDGTVAVRLNLVLDSVLIPGGRHYHSAVNS